MPRRPKEIELGDGFVVDQRNPRDYAREMAPLLRPYVKDEASLVRVVLVLEQAFTAVLRDRWREWTAEPPGEPPVDDHAAAELDLPEESSLFDDDEPDELPRRPPPKRPPRHLTVPELAQLVAVAKAAAERLPGATTERAFTLFLGEWLPKFKAAAHEGDEGVCLFADTWRALAYDVGGRRSPDEVRDALGLFEQVMPHGRVGIDRFPATWAIRKGRFRFESDASDKPLYLRTHKFGEEDRQWTSIREAAAGRDGRPPRARGLR